MPTITHAQNPPARQGMRRSLYDALLALALRRDGKLPAEVPGFRIATPAPESVTWREQDGQR